MRESLLIERRYITEMVGCSVALTEVYPHPAIVTLPGVFQARGALGLMEGVHSKCLPGTPVCVTGH